MYAFRLGRILWLQFQHICFYQFAILEGEEGVIVKPNYMMCYAHIDD